MSAPPPFRRPASAPYFQPLLIFQIPHPPSPLSPPPPCPPLSRKGNQRRGAGFDLCEVLHWCSNHQLYQLTHIWKFHSLVGVTQELCKHIKLFWFSIILVVSIFLHLNPKFEKYWPGISKLLL